MDDSIIFDDEEAFVDDSTIFMDGAAAFDDAFVDNVATPACVEDKAMIDWLTLDFVVDFHSFSMVASKHFGYSAASCL